MTSWTAGYSRHLDDTAQAAWGHFMSSCPQQTPILWNSFPSVELKNSELDYKMLPERQLFSYTCSVVRKVFIVELDALSLAGLLKEKKHRFSHSFQLRLVNFSRGACGRR